jgi:hypothetical protein
MDWFKAKITGNPYISWRKPWFPDKMFPSTNPVSYIPTDNHNQPFYGK